MDQSALIDQLDLTAAITTELVSTTRHLPRPPENSALNRPNLPVEKIIRAALEHNSVAERASVVLAVKPKGIRPLNVWRLQDRVFYRALTERIRAQLPGELQQRGTHADFEKAPHDNPANEYINATDITAFYQYVDHDLLADELIAQTGDYHSVTALIDLLGQVMGTRVGIPQVHTASDVLGDVYIDPIRRSLIRDGYDAYTYADDFRIGCSTLGQARAALECCASAAHDLGLVLNGVKTFTYSRDKYESTLNRRNAAQTSVLESMGLQAAADFFLMSSYDETGEHIETDLSHIDDTPAAQDDEENVKDDAVNPEQSALAQAVWQVWEHQSDTRDSQTVRQLLGEALPLLGINNGTHQIHFLEDILDVAPELTPKVALYLSNLASGTPFTGHLVDQHIHKLVHTDRLNDWQKVWLAYAAGSIRWDFSPLGQDKHPPKTVEWLDNCVASGSDALAASAADALGRLGVGDVEGLAQALGRVAAEHRPPIVLALGRLDRNRAVSVATGKLDRLLLPRPTA